MEDHLRFRFMELPPELRTMIYNKVSLFDGVIRSCNGGRTWAQRIVQLHRERGIHGPSHDTPFDMTRCSSLWVLSKFIRR